MNQEFVYQVIHSVNESEQSFCKFLSANDTGATGGHQSGILISIKAASMIFPNEQLHEHIAKKSIIVTWQNDFKTESMFTYYESKKELRLTRFGRKFPFLIPDQTGSLFILTKQSEEDYSGFFLDTEWEMDEFLNTFGMSPTETNCLMKIKKTDPKKEEEKAIAQFIDTLTVDFPTSNIMSQKAREINTRIYNHIEYIRSNPDKKIIDWTDMEYELFRALERDRYGDVIAKGFTSVDDFVLIANKVLNRRKSRAGKSLEHHLAAIFDGNKLAYSPQANTEKNKKPDFIFPSVKDYHDKSFPVDNLIMLAAKTTCKDRWRQILTEADRLKDETKYLCTLQQGISGKQMDEMQDSKVVLVVPKPYIKMYPADRRDRIWTLKEFIKYAKDVEKRSGH